jgi:hypothetical protein
MFIYDADKEIYLPTGNPAGTSGRSGAPLRTNHHGARGGAAAALAGGARYAKLPGLIERLHSMEINMNIKQLSYIRAINNQGVRAPEIENF